MIYCQGGFPNKYNRILATDFFKIPIQFSTQASETNNPGLHVDHGRAGDADIDADPGQRVDAASAVAGH